MRHPNSSARGVSWPPAETVLDQRGDETEGGRGADLGCRGCENRGHIVIGCRSLATVGEIGLRGSGEGVAVKVGGAETVLVLGDGQLAVVEVTEAAGL